MGVERWRGVARLRCVYVRVRVCVSSRRGFAGKDSLGCAPTLLSRSDTRRGNRGAGDKDLVSRYVGLGGGSEGCRALCAYMCTGGHAGEDGGMEGLRRWGVGGSGSVRTRITALLLVPSWRDKDSSCSCVFRFQV
jgi:hypothetical protein